VTYLENNKNEDFVRPGEQWFFYWKTSASLWEGRIVQFPQHEVIFIPIYWGFHAESATEWDFGRIQPERDLLRLTQLLTQHGRKFCWLLPLTPAPHLPNGGVPVSSARTLSISPDGVHLAALDQELHLNKMFSYFEPKVFQAFGQFLKAFGKFLSQNKIKAPVWGTQFYYHQDQQSISYLEDHSIAFEQGFSRYLKQNHPQGTELNEVKKEAELKSVFTEEVSNLFKTTAESSLSPFWVGVQKIISLGGSPKETISRALPGGKSQLEYTQDLFYHFVHHDLISSALLNNSEKKDTLGWILKEHFGTRNLDQRYQYQSIGAELTEEFRTFGVIDLFGGKKHNHFRSLGLQTFLDRHFKWIYQSLDELPFNPEWIDVNQHKIKFFHGEDLDQVTFAQILKLFMMGQRLILDRTGLGDGLDRKLQIFLLENNIKGQSVNFMTSTQIYELGEGRLIIFEGDRLIENPAKDKFWLNIFKYLSLAQPEMLMDEDVFSLWRIRATTAHELSYLDVRRVNIYNPTSYKKVVSIKTHKHFAFMKMIDPTRANAKSTPEGVDVELLPNGKIALDFGHYEET
jgi:hypothetical protein